MQIFSNELFHCEHLSFDERSINEINTFKVKHQDAINLEEFLKRYAHKDEVNHTNRTYLIKDKYTQELVCYFSLRNGLFTLDTGKNNFIAIPAVELSNFATNDNYKQKHPKLHKLGSTILNDFILPLVKRVQEFVGGTSALYLCFTKRQTH